MAWETGQRSLSGLCRALAEGLWTPRFSSALSLLLWLSPSCCPGESRAEEPLHPGNVLLSCQH